MTESAFKKYFHYLEDDLDNRRLRVWQRVQAHINYAAPSVSEPQERSFWLVREFGLLPLAASFVLIILGAGALNVFDRTLPGDRLYTIKRAVEEAQLKITPNDGNHQLAIIERRTQEIQELENKISSNSQASKDVKQQIETIKTEVGQKAIALSNNTEVTIVDSQPVPSVNSDEKPSTTLIVTVAEAKTVGEAVMEFLKSTALTGKDKEDKIKEIVTAVLTKPEVTETDTDPAESETDEPVETTEPEGAEQPSSVIEEEVESDEIEVR